MENRCAIYTRVSTDDQTTQNQILELKEIAQRKGLRVVSEFTDEGVSGAKGRDKRTGFDNLIKLTGDGSANVLTGGAGNDTLAGGGGNDTLVGTPGTNTLEGGTGNDTLTGGSGTDTATYANASGAVTVNLRM